MCVFVPWSWHTPLYPCRWCHRAKCLLDSIAVPRQFSEVGGADICTDSQSIDCGLQPVNLHRIDRKVLAFENENFTQKCHFSHSIWNVFTGPIFFFYKRCQGCVQQIYGVWVFGMQTRNCNGVIKFCIFSGAARKSSDWVPDYDPQAFLLNFLKNLLAFFLCIRTA